MKKHAEIQLTGFGEKDICGDVTELIEMKMIQWAYYVLRTLAVFKYVPHYKKLTKLMAEIRFKVNTHAIILLHTLSL